MSDQQTLVRLPKLRTMRDSNPITGEVWVVDENNHMVASFKIKRPECHLKGATVESVDASRNLIMAQAFIEHLEFVWTQYLEAKPASHSERQALT